MVAIAGGIVLAVVALICFAAFPVAIVRATLAIGAAIVLFPLALALQNKPFTFVALFGGTLAIAFAVLLLLRGPTKSHRKA